MRLDHCEKGYMSQPMPIAMTRKARNAQSEYSARSRVVRLDRKANVIETTKAKNTSAPKWVKLANSRVILVRRDFARGFRVHHSLRRHLARYRTLREQ